MTSIAVLLVWLYTASDGVRMCEPGEVLFPPLPPTTAGRAEEWRGGRQLQGLCL